jgi:16S rRNA (guanine966-N2)-methyltransferase
MRETLFNVLEHRFDGAVGGRRVLDLFAGTGALGLEALSRGAAYCLFVEEAAAARALVRENIEALGLQGRSKIYRRDATRLGLAGTLEPFDLVLADPPYGKRLGEQALASAAAGGWLAEGALCAVEEAGDAPFEAPPDFIVLDPVGSGASMVRLLRFQPRGERGRDE